jgi:hypothetical protein
MCIDGLILHYVMTRKDNIHLTRGNMYIDGRRDGADKVDLR